MERARSWRVTGGGSDHLPVICQFEKGEPKPGSPFKFNSHWFLSDDYTQLIWANWKHFDASLNSTCVMQFVNYLKDLKALSVDWSSKQRMIRDSILKQVEFHINNLFEECHGALNCGENQALGILEESINSILKEKAAEVRMKIRVVWLTLGDEKNAYFRKMVNHRKRINTI